MPNISVEGPHTGPAVEGALDSPAALEGLDREVPTDQNQSNFENFRPPFAAPSYNRGPLALSILLINSEADTIVKQKT